MIDAGRADARVRVEAPTLLAANDAGDQVPDAAARDSGFDSGIADAGMPHADAAATCGVGGDAQNSVDCCPGDPQKTAPGACGCGVADVDADGDGTADCIDACPADPQKIAPGECGCGLLDADSGGVAGCLGLRSALVHRYRFEGTGTVATDVTNGSNGNVVNATLDGTGTLTLPGGTPDAYVDLPNALVSTLHDATFEVWFTWSGGSAWQRIFDFGDVTSGTEGARGTGRSYLFLTPKNAASGVLRAVYKKANGSEVVIDGSAALPTGMLCHLAVVADDTGGKLSLYLNGTLQKSVAWSDSLSLLNDVNEWLGRSQYSADPGLQGKFEEFRIYGAALSAAQIATSFGAGPNPKFLEP
jgi:hypothetical protein